MDIRALVRDGIRTFIFNYVWLYFGAPGAVLLTAVLQDLLVQPYGWTVTVTSAFLAFVSAVHLRRLWMSQPERVDRNTGRYLIPRRPGYEWYRDQLKATQTAWVMWSTGAIVTMYDLLDQVRPERMILPLPDLSQNSGLSAFAAAIGWLPEEVTNTITKVTVEAGKRGISVRWWPGLIGNTMTIGNPGAPNAWALVEVVLPLMAPPDRPSLHIDQGSHPDLYEAVYRSYLNIWDDSKEAPKDARVPAL